MTLALLVALYAVLLFFVVSGKALVGAYWFHRSKTPVAYWAAVAVYGAPLFVVTGVILWERVGP